ncbi:MAG: tetratricopeptide repeat protein [Desulfuromonadaceae bacterium]
MYKEISRELFFGILVATIAFLVYANSLGNGFTLDDHDVILNNQALRGAVAPLFSIIDTINDTQLLPLYRPVTYLSFLIEWRLHGFNPFFVRLLNILLHSANAYLVYRIARSLFKENIYAALLTGILFAVHPLHTEGVDFNAGGRNTMLACFFSLAAYLMHHRSTTLGRIFPAFAGAGLFLAGLFSKESALMVLPLIAWLEIAPFRSGSSGKRFLPFLRLAPYCAATVIYLVMRWLTLSKLGIQTSIIPGAGANLLESMYVVDSLGTRMVNNLYIIPRYLLIAIWPTALSSRYVIPGDLNLLALPLFGSWVAILGCLGWVFTRGRTLASLFGLAWLILFWLPVSGLFIIPIPMAERYLYMPAIGLWIVFSDQLFKILQNARPEVTKYTRVSIIVVLLMLAALTIRRNFDWKSNVSLYTRFVEQYPENIHAQAGLGVAYYDTADMQNKILAERLFEKVIALDPYAPKVHTLIGSIKLNKGEFRAALDHYGRALEIFPNDKEARLNRGITLEKLGRPKEAITDYLFFLTSPGSSDSLPGGREHAEKRLRELAK